MKVPRYLIFISAVVIPGSGFVWLGKPVRGLMYLVWMLFFGFLTYRATGPNISIIGRLAGGIAIWVLSLLEMQRLLQRRTAARGTEPPQ